MRPALAAALFLVAPAAFAQTIALTLPGERDKLVKAGDSCDDTVRVTYAITPTGLLVCSDLKIWATTATSCPETPGAADKLIASKTAAQLNANGFTGTEDLLVKDLPVFTTEVTCPAAGLEQAHLVCASFEYASVTTGLGCAQKARAAQGVAPTITYDSKPPTAPTIDAVSSLDSALGITLTIPDDATVVEVSYRIAGAADPVGTQTFTSGSGRISGLQNNQLYELEAFSFDEAGNKSEQAATASGTPVLTEGFWARYRGAGGAEAGGCSTGGAELLSPLALAVLATLSRRKRG